MTIRTAASAGLLFTVLLALSAAAEPPPVSPPPVAPPAIALSPVDVGRMIAERDCSTCHAVGPEGQSPFEGAPRWRDLHNAFDVSDLAEALAEGITVGHEAMPARSYEPADVEALIAYMKTLEVAEPAATPKR